MAIGACKVHGAAKIIACDMFDQKLELAKEMGADLVVNSGKEDIIQAVRNATGGHGADAAIDITGNGKAINAGLKALRKGGIFVSVGLPDGEIPVNLTEDIIYREIVYTGVSGRRMFETWEVFNTDTKTYGANHFSGPYEIVSLNGTIDSMDGKFYAHLHMSGSRVSIRVMAYPACSRSWTPEGSICSVIRISAKKRPPYDHIFRRARAGFFLLMPA